ncbi:MAG: hypothetical protein Unbinned838contig1000_47 [Prokaryotic dsDNA virus sp.]|nr:MAG: hypothetical protein Unbinned838contig1000_47 [Prokaryotic dsDNA virus sp.]
MRNQFKHLLDTLFVSLLYIGMIVFPLFIVLNILNVWDLGSGLLNLIAIIFAVIFTIACKYGTREARISHNRGDRFLF